MQNSLLVLLILVALSLMVILTAMVRSKLKVNAFGPGKAFVAVLHVIILAVVAFYLHQQSTALDRLHSIGIDTPDTIGHVVGLASGTGAKPLWMFEYSGTESELVAFYASEKNRSGWSFVSKEQGRIQLRQEPVDLKISMDPGVVTFLLIESE